MGSRLAFGATCAVKAAPSLPSKPLIPRGGVLRSILPCGQQRHKSRSQFNSRATLIDSPARAVASSVRAGSFHPGSEFSRTRLFLGRQQYGKEKTGRGITPRLHQVDSERRPCSWRALQTFSSASTSGIRRAEDAKTTSTESSRTRV